jgi:predicted lipoprotein with Yx(FWY)xxD motif
MWRATSVVVCVGALSLGFAGLSATAGAQSEPTVSIGKVKGVGKVLVDANGHPVYSLVNKHQPVLCTGACLNEFVPLTVAPGSQPTGGKGVKGLGVVAGGTQVTENGFPLFLFPGDQQAKDANGQGMKSSGGTWNVVKVTGSKSGGKKNGGNAGTGGVSF